MVDSTIESNISNAIILPIAKICSLLDIESPYVHSFIEKINLSELGDGAISAEELTPLIEKLYQETGREDLGFLLGDLFEFEYTPEFTTYIQSLKSLRSFLDSTTWLAQFFSPGLELGYEEKNGRAFLFLPPLESVAPTTEFLRRITVEGVFTYILKASRKLVGPELEVEAIRLVHPNPSLDEQYEKYFASACEFSCERNEIVTTTAMLDQQLSGYMPSINEKAKTTLLKKLADKASPSMSSQVLILLNRKTELLSASIGVVAEYFHMGERTLQRRLKAEGSSFFSLQDKAKERIALELLKSKRYTVGQISDRLGFSDRRSFSRAFQRWQGCSPSQLQSSN